MHYLPYYDPPVTTGAANTLLTGPTHNCVLQSPRASQPTNVSTVHPQVVDAVKTEVEAIEVAEAFETVSRATKALTSAKEEVSATVSAVAQAAAVLSGLANATSGFEGRDGGGGRGRERDAGRVWANDKAAESTALALGEVMRKVASGESQGHSESEFR